MTVTATGVFVQALEHEISQERCLATTLDFNCARVTRTMAWGQLGGLALWGSGAAMAAGGASRLRRGRHVDDRPRRRAAIVLLALGGAGVAVASIVPSVRARGCEDVDCFARLTLARIVATDAAMLGMTLGGSLLASSNRPRPRMAAMLAPRMIGLAISRAF